MRPRIADRSYWNRCAVRPWGAEIRSCSSPVLVEEPSEQVTSLYPGLATLADEVQTNGWTWRLQPERPMRSVRVVMLDVDPEHLFQVASPDDQQPVQALGPHRADPALGVGVGVGACTDVTSISAPSARNTSSKLRENFASRSHSTSVAVVLVRPVPAAGCGPAG